MVSLDAPGQIVEPPVLWHFGFHDLPKSGHWMRRVLGRILAHPRHVVAFRDTKAGLLRVEQTLEGLRVGLQPLATAVQYAAEIVEDGGEVHAALVPAEGTVGYLPRPFSCVDVARSLACLPYKPQTPRQLARELSRRP